MMDTNNEIAIVGIGCNFPGGEGIDNFWRVLEEGKNCATDIPPERFDINDWYDPDDSKSGKTSTRRAAFTEEFNTFDNKLFGINDVEAERMDPQHKLLLECTYRALEDAGITRENINGTKTGVFVGMMNRDYGLVRTYGTSEINHYDGTGAAMSIAANRISYTFNLTGPSIAIDTACSSFHYALHFASHAIKQGDCEAAVCGGVNCIIDPQMFVTLTKAKMISPEGISKPFSRKADGYGRGEGCGVLLLKRFQKAKQDFNKIWGVISISAINQNGRSVSPITRPSQQEQENLLRSIYPYHIDPSMLQYIEAHGTGTPAGDPTEAESISNVICKKRSPNLPALKMGSVKGNIGHTESAAGAAGLIKVLLMMHHGKIVPSLHFSESTSSIDTQKLNLSIPTCVEKWEESSEFGRVAGVNCFGFGGTNAHVVVRQVKQSQSLPPIKRPVELFVLSATSGHSLKLALEDTARHVNTGESVTLPNLAYTSTCRRSHLNFKYRKAFVVSSLQDLEQQLVSTAEMEMVPSKKAPELIFVFPGNGLNLKGIFKTMFRSEPVFRDKCKEIEGLFQQWTSLSTLELTESGHDDLMRPEIAQPLLFILQVALVTLLQHWGVKPTAVIGHSVGEVAAAHCAGFISLEDAVKVIYHRSRLQAKVTGGRMLVVGNIPIQEVSEAIGAYSGKVCIAAFNSPQSCTLSGDAESINAIQKDLVQWFGGRDVFLHILNIPAAYHSRMMDPVLQDIAGSLSELAKQKPELELISTVTGRAASEDDIVSGSYWARQVRDPVMFAQAIVTSVKDKPSAVFVEIGPHRALQRNIIETLGKQTKVFPSLQVDREYEALLALIKGLFELGFNPDWPHLYDGYQSVPATYPRYQFDRKKLNSHINVLQQPIHGANHPLIHSVSSDSTEFNCSISQAQTPYIYGHKHNGVTLVPGAFFVELALAALMTNARPKVLLHFCELMVRFTSPCVLTEHSHSLKIKVELQKEAKDFKIMSPSGTVYALGHVTWNQEIPLEEKNISYTDIFQRCRSWVSNDEIYEMLSSFGFQYDSTMKQINDVFYCEELKEAITSIKVKKEIAVEMHKYFMHPILLDCFLQMTGVITTKTSKNGIGFPSSINSLVIVRPLEEEMLIYLKISKSTENYLEFCGCFTDKHGSILAEVKCVRITLMKETSRSENDVLFENKWKEVPHSHMTQNSGDKPKVAVFADKTGVSKQLQKFLHNDSRFLIYKDWENMLQDRSLESPAQEKLKLELRDYSNVLFMWGVQQLNEGDPDSVVADLSKCCEALRQIIIALRAKNGHCSIKIITYRTTERFVDHINPGFALCGMMRSCMVEVSKITFQIIDISTTSTMDISALADVLAEYKDNYSEIHIHHGRIYVSEIRRSLVNDVHDNLPSQACQNTELFSLFTSGPYEVRDLFAELDDNTDIPIDDHCLEVQIEKISLHSEDYFPVSVSSCNFGNTLYWNTQTIDKHRLLALDCSGRVVATGSKVREVKVGDHVVSCYPVTASSRIRIPEVVCFNTQTFPCFETVPCVSFFRIAWEILHQTLSEMKQKGSLGIISTEPESVLCKVLHLSAQEAGWKAIRIRSDSNLEPCVDQCNALVFLPPLERLPKAVLGSLSKLQDVVVICDNHHAESLRALIGMDHENFQIHILSLTSIFQKASLKKKSMPFSSWMKSLEPKQFLNLPCSVFQQTEKQESTGSSASSHLTRKAVPFVTLRDNVHSSLFSDIPLYGGEQKMFKEKAVYIVTGGLTGLGFETVRFIAENGGGGIVILSRRKPSVEKQKEITDLQHQNKRSKIISLQCNVISRSDVEKAISEVGKMFPKWPVKGVFHSAVVLHDGSIEALTISDFEEVFSPKVAGAMNLHHATQGQDLDYFVCYSSVASFLGNSMQANYAAANSFLDFFCHYRRNRGLAGQSINWGALNLGLLQNQNEIQNFLESKGIAILQVDDFYEYLKRCLILNNPQQAIIKFNFKNLTSFFISQNPAFRNRMQSVLMELSGGKFELSEQTVSQDLTPVKNEDYIMALMSQLSGTDPSDIAMNSSLLSNGIDSMLAMTLQNRIFQERRVNIPLVNLLDPNTTAFDLALLLEEKSKEIRKSDK